MYLSSSTLCNEISEIPVLLPLFTVFVSRYLLKSVRYLISPLLILLMICLNLSLENIGKNPNLINKSAHLSNLKPFSDTFGYNSKMFLIVFCLTKIVSKNVFKLIIFIIMNLYFK